MIADFGTVAYLAVLLLLLPFGLHRLWLLWLRLRPAGRGEGSAAGSSEGSRPDAPDGELPRPLPVVTVQLPVYNEAAVVERAVDAACRLDWPRDRLEVQVLDDSDDGSARLAARRVRAWRRRGVDVRHLRRESREGYKAGALAHGAARARGDLFLVLDADFVPPRDLVRRLAPAFREPEVGFVQAAWDHLNRDESWLTRAQAVLLDAHFAVEHAARHRSGLFFNFNGTAGMWRRACLEEVGGWSGATLTEDLELSYRAQMAGWRGVYRDDVRAPAELPGTLRALEVQQERWTRGGMQTARRVLPDLWRSGRRPAVKLEATAHLLGHLLHPLTLLLALALAWPGRIGGAAALVPGWVHGTAVTFAVLPFLLYYGTAAGLRGRGVLGAVPRVLEAVALGIGLGPPLAAAALRGLTDRASGTFRRTPKSGAGPADPAADRRPSPRRVASGRPPGRRPESGRGRTVVRGVLGLGLLVAGAGVLAAGSAAGAAFTLLFASGYLLTAAEGLRQPSGAEAAEALGRQQQEERDVDEGRQRRGMGPDAGRPVGVQAGIGQEDEAGPGHPGEAPPQGGEGEDPQQVPGMQGGRDEEGRAQGPEEGPLHRPAPAGGQQGHARHDQAGDEAGRPSPQGIEEGEEGGVEAPAGGVLAQALEEGGAGR